MRFRTIYKVFSTTFFAQAVIDLNPIDGSAYYSTKSVSITNSSSSTFDLKLVKVTGLTYQTGVDNTVRQQFVTNGVLLNTTDTNYRPVDEQWPVFAIARDMGSITLPTEPFVMSIGHVRDPAVQYVISRNFTQERSLYFWSAYSSIADAVGLPFLISSSMAADWLR